jgi:hypothetical protein
MSNTTLGEFSTVVEKTYSLLAGVSGDLLVEIRNEEITVYLGTYSSEHKIASVTQGDTWHIWINMLLLEKNSTKVKDQDRIDAVLDEQSNRYQDGDDVPF